MNDNNEDVLFAHLLGLAEEMLETMAKTMRKFKAHLESQDSRADILEHRIAVLEQSRGMRLDTIERRIAAQGDSMSYRIANAGDLAAMNLKRITAIEQHGGSLAQRCEMRITAIEQRLANLEISADEEKRFQTLMAELDEMAAIKPPGLPTPAGGID